MAGASGHPVAGYAPAAVPVMRNPVGGEVWSRVHATLAEATTLAAAGPGVDALRAALGGDEVTLSKLVRAGGDTWMAVVPFGPSRAIEWWPLAEHPTVRRAIETGVPHQVADTDPTAEPGELDVLAAGGYRALLLLPIEENGVELGILEVYAAAPRRWNVAEIAHARAACNQLSSLLRATSGMRPDIAAGIL
jgi:GAF domain-containing protein